MFGKLFAKPMLLNNQLKLEHNADKVLKDRNMTAADVTSMPATPTDCIFCTAQQLAIRYANRSYEKLRTAGSFRHVMLTLQRVKALTMQCIHSGRITVEQ